MSAGLFQKTRPVNELRGNELKAAQPKKEGTYTNSEGSNRFKLGLEFF
jgi:hypothetical protein